jgi:hypothetical protein
MTGEPRRLRVGADVEQTDLNRGVRIGLQVVKPRWVCRLAGFGRHDGDRVAVLVVHQR